MIGTTPKGESKSIFLTRKVVARGGRFQEELETGRGSDILRDAYFNFSCVVWVFDCNKNSIGERYSSSSVS